MFKTRVLKRSHAYGQERQRRQTCGNTRGVYAGDTKYPLEKKRRLIINMKKIRDFLNKKRKGMTLIELMIVVVIIGIVFAYAFVNAGANTEKAKKARTSEDIAAITSAAAMYIAEAADQDIALTALAGAANPEAIGAILNKKLSKPFASMKDGWGAAYSVTADATAKTIVIDCATAGKTDLDGVAFKRTLDFK